jgi:predicted RNA-binding protein YlqC (UPF0109 family)
VSELISFLVSGLVEKPENLSVDIVEGEVTSMVTITGAPEQIERLRGTDDCILAAIRAVVTATTGRRKVILELSDGGSA